ncbi:MAG: PEP-CTERM sorting domain-containing protein [Candidatus Thiodiazotropha sp. (ex Semelilucina semeliformis)]|nr:PEP-CTERM sorting domain-containing protein [Candidatus Thiodiazotropha sp. (ex Semelilucina semeliformis)]
MNRSLINRILAPGMMMLTLTSGLLFSSTAQSVALYDATIEADLVVTTIDPDLIITPAFGFTDFFSDVTPASPGSDAFGDADFFSTPDGFSAFAHADGIAVPSGSGGETTVVESFGEAFAFMDVEFFNSGFDSITVDFFVDYLWDWSLSVDSEVLEFSGLDLFLEVEVDGLFTTLVDVSTFAAPAGSDFGGGLDLFSFDIDPYGFSTLSMDLIASGSADSTVPVSVPEPAPLALMVMGLAALGLRRGNVKQLVSA